MGCRFPEAVPDRQIPQSALCRCYSLLDMLTFGHSIFPRSDSRSDGHSVVSLRHLSAFGFSLCRRKAGTQTTLALAFHLAISV